MHRAARIDFALTADPDVFFSPQVFPGRCSHVFERISKQRRINIRFYEMLFIFISISRALFYLLYYQ